MYGGPVQKLHELLQGRIIENVEDGSDAPEGGHFVLATRTVNANGKLGKLEFVRVCGTELGWWYETRTGTKGPWKRIFS